MAGGYFLVCSLLEKCEIFWKNGRFSGRIWPDWGNTTRADMAGLGSIGLRIDNSGHSVICAFDHISETKLDINT